MGEENEKSLQSETSFPIVGIGASAGGLEALQTLFKNIPADIPMAFVVVQHLMPDRESNLPSILQQSGKLKARQIKDGMEIEPRYIYVGPPSNFVSIENRILHLHEMKDANNKFTIDAFFRSLAEDQQEKSICVVLSGTGTDGTLGLKTVKEVGGITIVQSEDDAEYPDMPGSAIETGMVDHVRSAEQIPGLLQEILRHPYLEITEKEIIPEEKFEDYLSTILQILYKETGHDFSEYKDSTIQRRIERRTAIHQVLEIEEYIEILKSDPSEVKALFKDLLINVTNFFREPEAYEALKHEALPRLIQGKDSTSSLRVWVPGCSTGEEAYSITMIFMEAMEMLNQHFSLQVFATDLDQDAIQYARRGVYPESIAADVSQERLKRFFNEGNKTYEVKKQLRDKVIFAVQNIIKDPPFSHLDMVSCRNLLIYMNSQLQDKVIPLFHYVLNIDGILFLGSSETVGQYTKLFHPLEKSWRIYKRNDKASYRHEDYPRTSFFGSMHQPREMSGSEVSGPVDYDEMARSVILESYSPPGVLVNSNHEILYFHGDTDPYLEPPRGDAKFNVLNMARGDLEYKINQGLHLAAKKESRVTMRSIEVHSKDRDRVIDIIISPLGVPSDDHGLYLIVFDKHSEEMVEEAEVSTAEKVQEEDRDSMVRELQHELQSTKEELYDTIEELETSNEELKSMNEELQSTNEELQSANEELETSREEVQSTNEELETVNKELEGKIEELSETNTILQNLLKDEDYGAIFLDTNLVIRRFTPLIESIFNIRKSDVGRPLTDLTSRIPDQDLSGITEHVLDTLETQEREVQSSDDKWFYLTIKPYRTDDHVIKGVVIRFKNITDYKRTAEKLERESQILCATFDELETGMMLVTKESGKIQQWNNRMEAMLLTNHQDLEGKRFTEYLPDEQAGETWDQLIEDSNGEQARENQFTFVTGENRPVELSCKSRSLNVNNEAYIIIFFNNSN